MSSFPNRWMPYLLFAAVTLPLSLWGLGSTDAVSMEGIVADGARYMSETGELAVPRLHGEIYSYKPPLAYWLALASFQLTGAETELTLRLPFALSGLLMAIVVFWGIGARLGPWIGAVCGVASLSGAITVQKMRLAEFDMPLTAGAGIAATLAILDLSSKNPRLWRWGLAYLALGAAFLCKGIPALMYFGPGLLVAAWWTGRLRRLFSIPHLAGGLVFCLVVGAWIAAAWSAEGWAAFSQPFAEADEKGLTWSLEAVGATLVKPLVLVGAFFPWSLFLPFALRGRYRDEREDDPGATAGAAAGFVVGGLLAFMAVPAGETRYLLPLAAPVGILCGLTLFASVSGVGRAARYTALVLGALLGLAAPVAGFRGELTPTQAAFFFVAGALLFGLGLRVERLGIEPRRRSAVLTAATALCLGTVLIGAVDPHRASSRSLRHVAEAFEPHLGPDETLWVGLVSAEWHHSSLFFYLRRPVRTFTGGAEPPPGAAVVLFDDEPPGFDPGFEHRVLEERTNRDNRFVLVRAAQVRAGE